MVKTSLDSSSCQTEIWSSGNQLSFFSPRKWCGRESFSFQATDSTSVWVTSQMKVNAVEEKKKNRKKENTSLSNALFTVELHDSLKPSVQTVQERRNNTEATIRHLRLENMTYYNNSCIYFLFLLHTRMQNHNKLSNLAFQSFSQRLWVIKRNKQQVFKHRLGLKVIRPIAVMTPTESCGLAGVSVTPSPPCFPKSTVTCPSSTLPSERHLS